MKALALPAFLFALLAAASDPAAKDLSADLLSAMHDLMAPHRAGGGEGSQAAPVADALKALRREKLVEFPRPNTRPLGVAESLGRALAMGRRTAQFLPELGAVRDALVRRDEAGTERAIQDLYTRMGRARPEGRALTPLLSAVRAAAALGPDETERHVVDRPSYRIEITNARSSGQIVVDVETRDAGRESRVTFIGDMETVPDRTGRDFDIRIRPREPCSSAAEEDAQVSRSLSGRWAAADGKAWEISGGGPEIVLTEIRDGKPPLAYRGSFRLGRIEAFHPFESPDDMEASLPAAVRSQLVAWEPKLGFRVRLALCGSSDRIEGHWSSQHVTYSGMTMAVSHVHDPYDVRLVLTRGEERGRGGLGL